MNNKLASHVLRCLSAEAPNEALIEESQAIVDTHNTAASYGFIDLPIINYTDSHIDLTENAATIIIQPKSGTIDIDELYNLKSAWGADKLFVSNEGIELDFLK